jgi:choline dehydrogenase-like flavoprotein
MRRSGDTLRHREVLSADVVVIGAGPIGIVAALELADAGHRVLVAESGGDKRDQRADALGDSASQDPYHVAKHLAVQRGVGGTSALWGGRCVPFDRIDFEARWAVPEDVWPISYDEIAPYFGRTCDWFVAGSRSSMRRSCPDWQARR